MRRSTSALSDLLSTAPRKELHAAEERSPLELTAEEKKIAIKFIRRIGILFLIERIALCVLGVLCLIAILISLFS